MRMVLPQDSLRASASARYSSAQIGGNPLPAASSAQGQSKKVRENQDGLGYSREQDVLSV